MPVGSVTHILNLGKPTFNVMRCSFRPYANDPPCNSLSSDNTFIHLCLNVKAQIITWHMRILGAKVVVFYWVLDKNIIQVTRWEILAAEPVPCNLMRDFGVIS